MCLAEIGREFGVTLDPLVGHLLLLSSENTNAIRLGLAYGYIRLCGLN